jgi:hypothetical protein
LYPWDSTQTNLHRDGESHHIGIRQLRLCFFALPFVIAGYGANEDIGVPSDSIASICPLRRPLEHHPLWVFLAPYGTHKLPKSLHQNRTLVIVRS